MLYREMGKTGDRVSILGYGCMRFPRKSGRTDEERTERQITSAIERGVNYFDTAYIYGDSEVVLGRILAKGHRDKVLIATKMPPIQVHSVKDMERILDAQLKRLQTDHIDYYLIHMLRTMEGWERLRHVGIEGFLAEAKRAGKIRRVGFSFHGGRDQFPLLVDAYPWDFCQIQYNYMDEHNQAGRDGLRYAAAKGLGVVVMEPLRGGYLVGRMPQQVKAVWDRAEVKRTPAEWALRWVWNHPEVSLLLSGMNEESHIEENIKVAEGAYPQSLSNRELELIHEVRESLAKTMKVGCTGCAYCLPCPSGVNIPMCFSYYNDKHLYGERMLQFVYLFQTAGTDGGKPSYASLCRECGKCESHCPQGLPIRQHLKEVARDMEGLLFKPVTGLIRGYYGIRGLLAGRRAPHRLP